MSLFRRKTVTVTIPEPAATTGRVRIYAAEGDPATAHYERPGKGVPLCPLGMWRVPWTVPVTEAEIQYAAVLPLCHRCEVEAAQADGVAS